MTTRHRWIHLGSCLLLLSAVGCAKPARDEAKVDSANGAMGAATPTSDTSHKAVSAIPAAVDSLGSHAEDLYDEVKAASWTKAERLLAALRSDIVNLPDGTPAKAKENLKATADSLAREIATRRKAEAMADANKATYVSAELVRDYASVTPVQVLLLDYEGRELELWSSQRNMARLATVKSDLRRIWDEVKPKIESRNAKQASHTETLVARIEKANTPAEIAKLATPFLDEVDLLEKVFTNQ